MSAQATPAKANDNPRPHDADAQGYRQVLHDLISMGTDLARFLHAQAAAQAAQQIANAQPAAGAQPAPASDALIPLAAAFDRTARAVRRGILLARSLDKPVQPTPLQPAHDPAAHRATTRRRIIREVEDTIQRTTRGASAESDGAETLNAELRDRLDAPDLDDDISTRPAADIIAEICRDLGLAASSGTRPWKRRTPDDIRQLCARAAAPSGTHQLGPCQPGTGPQTSRRDVAQPGPMHAGNEPPENPSDDTAGTVPTISRRPAPVQGEWRPPPQA